MKIKQTENSQGFKPITFEITIENIEELRMFQAISKLNVSIPELVDEYGGSEKIAADFLKKLGNIVDDL